MAKTSKAYIYQPLGEVIVMSNNNRNYGCMSFLFDVIMTLLTGGLWLIWVFVREMRNR